MRDQFYGKHAPHMRTSEHGAPVDSLEVWMIGYVVCLLIVGAALGWVARGIWP